MSISPLLQAFGEYSLWTVLVACWGALVWLAREYIKGQQAHKRELCKGSEHMMEIIERSTLIHAKTQHTLERLTDAISNLERRWEHMERTWEHIEHSCSRCQNGHET